MKNPNKFRGTLISAYLGYVTQSIVVNLASLFFVIFRTQYGITYEFLATLILLTFLIQLLVDLFSIKFISSLGFRKCAVLSQLFSFIGLVSLGVSVPLFDNSKAAIVISVLIYSVGGGLIEVVVSPMIDALPSESKDSSMSLLHSFYSWGQVLVIIVTTALLKIFGHSVWYFIPLIWSVLPLINTFNFARVPIIEPELEKPAKITKNLIGSKTFILLFVMMICSGAAEQVIAQWASLFCENGLGVSKVVGDLLGPCMFAACMGIGRTFYGIKGASIDLNKALSVCSVLSIACYVAASFFKSPVISLAGCALCGLGVSLMWPGILSFAACKFSSGGAAVFSLLALAGDVGCSIGPYITGIISDKICSSPGIAEKATSLSMTVDEFGMKCGIAAGIVFPIITFLGTLILKSKKNAEKG